MGAKGVGASSSSQKSGISSEVIGRAVKEALQDSIVLTTLAEKLMEVMMPMILTQLKELNMFNGEFVEDFEAYKSSTDEKIEKIQMETAKKIDAIEQNGRMNSVRIFGIDEQEDEDTSQLVAEAVTKHLKIKVSKNDIDVSHRLGGTNANADSGKPRPIIAKFVRREMRLEVLRNRKLLKSKPISIHPDLTRPRAYLLREYQAKHKDLKCWADFNGRIWREATATEKRQKKLKIELLPKKFPGIYASDEVDFKMLLN